MALHISPSTDDSRDNGIHCQGFHPEEARNKHHDGRTDIIQNKAIWFSFRLAGSSDVEDLGIDWAYVLRRL